ncbi:MAG: VOC family protein [Pseudomonadota bacterium]|jgi:catechol 2,3-dioxygenase-like lactoylglutathione lyase family enzyme
MKYPLVTKGCKGENGVHKEVILQEKWNMALAELDHYNIVTGNLERSVEFYEQVLGLRNGERPNFGIPGAWLYCGDKAVVHLIGLEKNERNGSGAIDHVAFRATDFDGTKANLQQQGIKFSEMSVPGFNIRQIFVHDPDGVKVELNFFAS